MDVALAREMSLTMAHVPLKSMSSYSQSKYHSTPFLEGESAGDHERRTWRERGHWKLNAQGEEEMVIPFMQIHKALIGAAQYSGQKIKGQGAKTWTQKFESGIMMTEDIPVGVLKKDVKYIALMCDAQGQKGKKGSRVERLFPIIPEWKGVVEIIVLDPIITKDIMRRMMNEAGLFRGLGRWGPRVGGANGRFTVDGEIDWLDNRREV